MAMERKLDSNLGKYTNSRLVMLDQTYLCYVCPSFFLSAFPSTSYPLPCQTRTQDDVPVDKERLRIVGFDSNCLKLRK